MTRMSDCSTIDAKHWEMVPTLGTVIPALALPGTTSCNAALSHRTQVLDFFLRALSVEIPVPAYICR